jgi:hypothetical protein
MYELLKWCKENQYLMDIPDECIERVEHSLTEEKAEIIKAREHGVFTMINGTVQDKQLTSEDYFNNTYKNQ